MINWIKKLFKPDQEIIRFVGTLKKIEVEKGDIVVLQYSGVFNEGFVDAIKAFKDEHLPGIRVIMLENGMEIGVLSPKNIEGPVKKP